MPGPALLLGRDREVAALNDALAAAREGSPQTVLVGGDAGMGKTTLVKHGEQQAAELGFTVAVGHCLDVEADISFAPVVEAVRTLVSGVADLDDRPSVRRVRSLLDPETPRSVEPVRLLDDLRQAVLEAAATGPVLLLLEDLHWADRSTQDFVSSLSRTARGHLLLVLTFRSDELHRRHPFRLSLAELGRAPGTTRLDLSALDRDHIEGIALARTGRADASVVDSVLARSEGNPLYAEELLDAERRGMPEPLADLFLARVDALPDDVRALLRLASVSGTRLDTDTLPALAGLERGRVDALLREALDAHVLRHSGDFLEFRHGLLREAVYDDLMPDERTRVHADLAAILQANVDAEDDPGLSSLSRLAFHWNAAHDLTRTLVASIHAASAAARLGAAEEITQVERALALWDRVPDAEAVTGLPQLEVVVRLGEAAGFQARDERRKYELVRRAVDMLEPDTDPLLVSRLYSTLAYFALWREDPIGAEEAARRAVACAGESASEELARALLASASCHNFSDRLALSLVAAERAADVAEAVGCRPLVLSAWGWRSMALFHLGHVTESLEEREREVAEHRRSGRTGEALCPTEHLAWQRLHAGQVDRGLALATEGFDEAMALGLPQQAVACGDWAVEALIWLGRLDEAERRFEVLRGLGLHDARDRRLSSQLLLARGDVASAPDALRDEASMTAGFSAHADDDDALRQLQLASMLDDESAQLEVASSYLAQLEECASPLVAGAGARIGYQALARIRSTEPRPEELRDRAAGQLQRSRAGLTDEWRGGYYGVQLALAEAYAARVAGEPAVSQFREAVALAEPFGAFFALEPQLELAEELLAHGGRDEGRELLVDCWTEAHDMGASSLEQRAFRLATRTRVPLPESATREGPLSRLTPREREVLDLLATGATNKTIAGTLFISEKTVSVHVTHLLGKLNVENRGAASALARRLVG